MEILSKKSFLKSIVERIFGSSNQPMKIKVKVLKFLMN